MKLLKRPFLTLLLALSILPAGRAAAQSFGFGSETEEAGQTSAASTKSPVTVSGELTLGGILFPDDLYGSSALLGNASTARLNLGVTGNSVDAALKLKITESSLKAETAADFLDDAVDEAYLRFFFGPATVEGGLMKVSWGKADSQGPLDVLNPYNLTDLTVIDTLERKIAQPMLRAVWAVDSRSKLEAVFLPSFEGHDIALTGKWAPSAIGTLLGSGFTSFSEPDTDTLDYAQAGLRFTTTAGSVDWGLQYFYGYLPTPAFNTATFPVATVLYNRYHQVGADLAAVLAGFNLRAELAGDITEDLDGDDPLVYNPTVEFSLGADRDIVAGINLNLQYAGSVRLADSGVAASGDIESGTDAFSSTLTAVAYQKLFRDKFEWRFTALCGIADEDFLLIPSMAWTEGDAEIKLAAGIFGGDAAGQMGQYADSSYLKLTLTYRF